MSELPKGWSLTKVGLIGEIVTGGTPKTSNLDYYGGDIPFYKPTDLDQGFRTIETKDKLTEAGLEVSRQLPAKSILVTCIGATIGKTGLIWRKGASNQQINAILPKEDIIPEFTYYQCISSSFQKTLIESSSSTTLPILNKTKFSSLPFILPPFNEQKRIVAKLDLLFAHLDGLNARLERVPELLKQFRQSVLTQAVTGKLTEDWRGDNASDQSSTPIEIEKNANYSLNNIPKSWVYSIIGNLGEVKGGKRLPKGESLVSENTGYPYIRARDLKEGTVLANNLLYLKAETQEKIKRYTVSKDDVYITIVGAKIGDAGTIPEFMDGANLTENACKITKLKHINSDFLSIWLRSPICQDFIRQTIMSAAQGKLALTRIKKLPIYVSPIKEQKEIVRRVEALFEKADSIERQYELLKEKIEHLPQAILAQAFRGELVPQDPTDEPAEVLLKKVQDEKADAPAAKKKKQATEASASKNGRADTVSDNVGQQMKLEI